MILAACIRCGQPTATSDEFDYGLCADCHIQGIEAAQKRERLELHRGDAERMVIERGHCAGCGWPISDCDCRTPRMIQ